MTAEFNLQTLSKLEVESPECLDWVDAYVRGSLDQEVLDGFEDFLLANPEMLPHIEAAELLHGQRPQVQTQAQTQRSKPIWQTSWAQAATVVLAVLIGFVAGSNWPEAPKSQGLNGEIALSATRSGAQDNHVPFVAGPRLLTVTVPADASGHVLVEILHLDGTWQSASHDVPIDLGMVLITVPELPPGKYEVNVVQDSEVLASSDFQVSEI